MILGEDYVFTRKKSNILDEYKLRLKFSDGIIKDVDLKNELYVKYLNPYIEMFKKVKVNPDTNTIEWETVADLINGDDKEHEKRISAYMEIKGIKILEIF